MGQGKRIINPKEHKLASILAGELFRGDRYPFDPDLPHGVKLPERRNYEEDRKALFIALVSEAMED